MSKKTDFDKYLEASEALGEDVVPNSIHHPAIVEQRVTSLACPEQHQGMMNDGRMFYFRYRHGNAYLGLGWTEDAAVMASTEDGDAASMHVGDSLQGMFDDDRQRDRTFAWLLAEIYH